MLVLFAGVEGRMSFESWGGGVVNEVGVSGPEDMSGQSLVTASNV